ncbi:MAG: hypothetical protein M3Y54_16935 [Bacteroidota bacterium]|nr:hypothetical protein [Bacteroidota bacterium]
MQAVLVFKDWQQVRWIALVAMAGGLAGGIAASTTFHAMPRGLPPKAAAIFAIHEQYAGYTLWLAGITLLLAGVGEYFQIRRRAYAVLVLLPALAAAGAVSWTGHHGAQLVYVEGVGPKGNMVMSEEEEAREEKAGMDGMDMGSPKGAKKVGEEPMTPASDSFPGQESPSGMNDMKGMKGMDMSGNAAQPANGSAQSDNAMSGMGNMNMSGKPSPSSQTPAQGKGSMADMPGMKTKKQMPSGMEMKDSNRQGMDNMKGMKMDGMDMNATPNQRGKQTMPAMPDMDMKKGVGKQPAGAKKQRPMKGISGMEGMNNMPGMNDAGKGQLPASSDMGAMKGMPGTEKDQAMPGMSMPSPMDKYRFEDNNPARDKPKRDN